MEEVNSPETSVPITVHGVTYRKELICIAIAKTISYLTNQVGGRLSRDFPYFLQSLKANVGVVP
jgi:hypothetical protein